ncbi:hypothetical protein ACTXJX_10805 [Glutamicibacter ardleyensis]|uniref:hypothetical protein n=1 Tax=Glutamicibacter ardleyensis TaxID=225894 RepID=UPI003FD0DC29
MVVESTPEHAAEALAFFEREKAKESHPQKLRARSKSTVFDFMQYREHPDSGVVMLTKEQIDAGFAYFEAKGALERRAMIWHDMDRKEVDDGSQGELKPLHAHWVMQLISVTGVESRVTIREVSEAFKIPSARIRIASDGPNQRKGQNAAKLTFLDFASYLPHRNPKAAFKYQYAYSRAESNFDFEAEVEAHVEMLRSGKRGGRGGGQQKLTDVDALAMRVQEEGLTLAEARTVDPLAFNRGESRITRARATYLAGLPQPPHRINYYMFGDGGTGKDALARALARALVPGDWIPGEREPFFLVGGDNVTWEGYDGQPVVIIEEARAGNLIKSFGRKELFAYLNPFPAKQRLNVKNSSVMPVNVITIMTGPDDYATFLDGLAGEYTDRSGEKHHAENKNQSYRRVPIIIPVRENEFDLMVNKGFMDGTGEFREYYAYQGLRQNMRQVLTRVKGIADDQRRIETHLAIEAKQVAPISEKHQQIVAATRTENEDPDALLAEFADLGEPVVKSDAKKQFEVARNYVSDFIQRLDVAAQRRADATGRMVVYRRPRSKSDLAFGWAEVQPEAGGNGSWHTGSQNDSYRLPLDLVEWVVDLDDLLQDDPEATPDQMASYHDSLVAEMGGAK